MAYTEEELKKELETKEYEYGFYTDIESDTLPKGLNEDIVRAISKKKEEPEWMTAWRLEAFAQWKKMEEPEWANVHYEKPNFQDISYYSAPNKSAQIEHEATTSKIGEDQIFYCNQRGIDTEKAIALIVNGFSKEVLNKLPMEFAVEAQKLLEISLEGSVG